ncbi:MAG: hypothetical protein PHU23_04010 [Dehalococcoidales bacterium]|nr:hypothetical protein [Dehalococcoidales bacterium]
MNDKLNIDDFDPTMHIIPLNAQTRAPVMVVGDTENDNTLVAVSDNGRISFLPVEAEIVYLDNERIGRTFPIQQALSNRIAERFPNGKDINGNQVNQFLAVGVMFGIKGKEARFIFEVWGFLEHFGELDVIYSKLDSLHGITVGGKEYTEVESFLSSEPVSKWINQLIAFLKEQLDWPNYVRRALEAKISDDKDSIYRNS